MRAIRWRPAVARFVGALRPLACGLALSGCSECGVRAELDAATGPSIEVFGRLGEAGPYLPGQSVSLPGGHHVSLSSRSHRDDPYRGEVLVVRGPTSWPDGTVYRMRIARSFARPEKTPAERVLSPHGHVTAGTFRPVGGRLFQNLPSRLGFESKGELGVVRRGEVHAEFDVHSPYMQGGYLSGNAEEETLDPEHVYLWLVLERAVQDEDVLEALALPGDELELAWLLKLPWRPEPPGATEVP